MAVILGWKTRFGFGIDRRQAQF